MESVHKPWHRVWIDNEVVNVKEFFEKWKRELAFENNDHPITDAYVKSLMTEEEYQNVVKECSPDALRCAHQDKIEPTYIMSIPNDVCLETVKRRAEELKKRNSNRRYAAVASTAMKFSNFPTFNAHSSVTNSCLPHNPVVTPEVVLSVQLFHPERKVDANTKLSYSKLPLFQLDQEFLALGCQYLTELRDKIDCVADRAVQDECSEDPTATPTSTCKDLYKSGFFFINGVFYNDMRDKNCRDYSEVIMKWAEKKNRGIGPFRKAAMEETRFIDLDIQLGYPYVYTHQGDCEHLFVFNDLRMFSKDDVNNRNAYPVCTEVKSPKRIFCMVCHVYTSSWVVYESNRLPENPFFFCKQCFFKFNYDSNNQKIGEFKAYHFPDPTKFS